METEYIGRYRVVAKLGRGGMGNVVRAVDEVRGRDVAIKLPIESDPQVIERLKQECDVLAQLQHHNIVQVFGSGSDPEVPFYIVMEFVDGETVEDLVQRQGALETRQALGIALGVAEALAHAHRPPRRVIHRDIKPANVLIRTNDKMVKVTDFGIAAVLSQRVGRTAVGTMAYMAPEQAMGQGVDERSDLYSLGALLYEMLTGQRPPQIAAAPAQPPSQLPGAHIPPEISKRVDGLTLGLLERDPNRRAPRSAAEAVEALRAILEGRPARQASASGGASLYDPTMRSAQRPQTTRYPPPLPSSGGPPSSYPQPQRAPRQPSAASQQVPYAPYAPSQPPYALPPPPQPVQIVPIQPLIAQPVYQVVPVVRVAPLRPAVPTSGKAIAAMVLGILLLTSSCLVPYFFTQFIHLSFSSSGVTSSFDTSSAFVSLAVWFGVGLLPVILGHVALGDIRRAGGRLGGNGLAVAGLVMGYVGLAGLLALLLYVLSLG